MIRLGIVKYNLTSKKLELTETDKAEIDGKVQRLKRFVSGQFNLDIVLKHDSHHRQGDVIDCRMTLTTEGNTYHAERVNSSVANAVDEVVEALKKELVKSIKKGTEH